MKVPLRSPSLSLATSCLIVINLAVQWVTPARVLADAPSRDQIVTQLGAKGPATAELLRKTWAKEMFDDHQYEDLAEVSQLAVSAVPQFEQTCEQLLEWRTRALLAMNRPADAIVSAKSFYNVATVDGLPRAIDLISRCLRAEGADGPSRSTTFRLAQIRGLTWDQSKRVPSDGVLTGVRVSDAPYLTSIKSRDKHDWFGARFERGNLLLMADHRKEALVEFVTAYSYAADRDLAKATSGVARALKAIDGSVGRANAFVACASSGGDPTTILADPQSKK